MQQYETKLKVKANTESEDNKRKRKDLKPRIKKLTGEAGMFEFQKSMLSDIMLPTKIYDLARMRLSELKLIAKEKAMVIEKYPEGKIHVIKSNNRTQYYLRTLPEDKSGRYIHKKDERTIKRYLQKSYDEKVYKIVQNEIKSIEAFLKHSNNSNLKIQNIYSKNPQEVKTYLKPIDYDDEDYINYWMNMPFKRNTMAVPETEYKTDKGELVRSKSEINIANALNKAGIPYKYECPLELESGKVYYPDFTILDVKNRKEIYWEHRGMMDDPEYVYKSVKKIKDYNRNGIIAGANLIITEEMGTSPLGTDEIKKIIDMISDR